MKLKGLAALETWCKRITSGYSNVNITNMTTSWRDGLGFCAIIHYHCPDLIDYGNLHSEHIFQNNCLAFKVAEEYLGIPTLLDPKDMMECEVVDKISIITYLAQYYMALHNPAELQRRLQNTKLLQSFAASRIDNYDLGDTKEDKSMNSVVECKEYMDASNFIDTGPINVSNTSLYPLGKMTGGTRCSMEKVVGQEDGTINNIRSQTLVSDTREGETNDSVALKMDVGRVKSANKPGLKLQVVTGDVCGIKQENSNCLQVLEKEIFDLDIKIFDIKIENLKKRGLDLENKVRESRLGQNLNSNVECSGREKEEELILQLFDLVKEKNELVRKQSEFMFSMKERMLRADQALCEERVRVLLNKPARLKTESDMIEEARLINKGRCP